MDVEIVAQYQCELGEGPLWHPMEKCLYWTDIEKGRLYRYDRQSGEHGVVYEGRSIGGFTYQADGALLLFQDRGTVAVFRDGKVAETIIDEIPEEADTRFNDVGADPRGRVFCGTMSTEDRQGRLYLLETDGSYRVVFDEVGCSNGIGFTPDRKGMYYTDSLTYAVHAYDYDEATGAMKNQRVLATVDKPVLPDGLTVDANGDIWSARWDGGCVVCHGPDGAVKRTIELPAAKITSVMFGGDDFSELYITSAAYGGDGEKNPEYAGALFRIRPGVKGKPEFASRIGLSD